METPIRDIHELQMEIGRLKNLEAEQSVALKARFSGPAAIFSTAMSLFPGSATVDGVKSAGFFNQDFLGLISRFALPIALNKTLFRKSNFIVKTLVGILSQKASHYISEDNVSGVWGKAKGVINNLFKKKEKVTVKEPLPAVVTPGDVPPYQPY
ncbi:hypothetical protein [Mucilaginibacter phyllosphaerae]|uniref:Uncharacterized protein n=1 Tax=Mucilaginibacter phyllosphaerae TaxID=1812349 RepID=A0A4Y8A607_9SPHI|nr:hypothetical protein [Mucilaginibacter phyllosphaerae]MBB3971098.1 hypothetical protein [Mucilaginibacter phyllosphaerae]TEW63833.1 hypothetical protein E2R65_18890 [Mucilaginibacter phyllosphaerae]GGH22463.1 hypothetical protein GCM10007352_35780 [Mucilaginibacter phyllosphaerae]